MAGAKPNRRSGGAARGGKRNVNPSGGRPGRGSGGGATGASRGGASRAGGGRASAGRTREGVSSSSAGSYTRGSAMAARRPSQKQAGSKRSAAKRDSLGGERVEGRQAVRELLLSGKRRVHEVLMSAGMEQADVLDDIIDLADELKVPIREVSRTKFDALAHTQSPQGVFAEADPLPKSSLEDLIQPDDATTPFLVALDGVTDPGNLGAVLRSAECAGATGVVLPRHRSVHVTPTVTKAAAGAVEFVPMALVGGLASAISDMQRQGVLVVGLDETGDASLSDLDLAGPLCLILGDEGAGLGRLVRERCDAVAAIPMGGRLNSLNVAAAGAVACFEVARQRQGSASSATLAPEVE